MQLHRFPVLRPLESRVHQKRKEEVAELQSCAGQIPAAQNLLPICGLFHGGSSIGQVEFQCFCLCLFSINGWYIKARGNKELSLNDRQSVVP